METVITSLTTSPVAIITGDHTKNRDFVEFSNRGAGLAHVGTGLDSSGNLVDFIEIASGAKRRIETKAIKGSGFYGKSDATADLATTFGGNPKNADSHSGKFKIKKFQAKQTPADNDERTVFLGDREGHSYLHIKNTDGSNSIDYSFKLDGETLSNALVLAAGASIEYNTESLGGVSLYAEGNLGDVNIEVTYG